MVADEPHATVLPGKRFHHLGSSVRGAVVDNNEFEYESLLKEAKRLKVPEVLDEADQRIAFLSAVAKPAPQFANAFMVRSIEQADPKQRA